MAYLLDTNILARLANIADAQHHIATHAVIELHRRGEALHVTPQVIIEFRNVATRSIALNGLGLSVAEVNAKTELFEQAFPLLPETPDIYPAWKLLVDHFGVVGKQVHDARLVAVCHAAGVTNLLSFNVGHLARFADFGPGVAVVDPNSI